MIDYDDNKYYTELDIVLQTLSLYDWKTFCLLVGEDNIEKAKICILRSRGKSFGQISINMNKPRSTAQSICNKCPEPEKYKHI
jgi:hypothetical protein